MAVLSVHVANLPNHNARTAQEIAERIIESHPDLVPFSAREILSTHPELLQHATIVIDLAYEEFCRRTEGGEFVDPESFVRDYESVAEPLRRQLLFHLAVGDLPEALPSAFVWPDVPGPYLHFDIVQQFGEGGASRVYLATDRHLGDRPRILKVSQSIRREATSLSKLNHPAIVDALYCDHDAINGADAICLPLQGRSTLLQVIAVLKRSEGTIRGAADLWKQLAEQDDTPNWARLSDGYAGNQNDPRTLEELFVTWARQILDGLSHAHERGFLHCDVKPSNILITWDGNAVLLDFDASLSRSLQISACGGTLGYMAPEQLSLLLKGRAGWTGRLEPATDLYGWAVTLFELLSLRSMFPMEMSTGSMNAALERQFAARKSLPLSFVGERRTASPVIRDCLSQCLGFEIEGRPQSALAVRKQLDRYFAPWERCRRFAWRNPGFIFIGLAVTTLLVFGAIDFFRPNPLRDLERGERALAAHNLDSALELLTRAVQRQPDLQVARQGLVKTLLLQSRFDQALTHLNQLPEDDWNRRCRAYCLVASGQTPIAAVEIYRRFIDANAAEVSDYNNAAFALLRSKVSGDLAEAEGWLQTAIRMQPNFAPAWANLLMVHRRKITRSDGHHDKAFLREAATVGRESALVQSELALTWAKVGYTVEQQGETTVTAEVQREAVAAFQEAVKLGAGEKVYHEVLAVWPSLKSLIAMPTGREFKQRLSDQNGTRTLWNPAVTP